MGDPTRPVPTLVGPDGTHRATTLTSPTSNTVRARATAPPTLAIPIVFVPGIMGSNLKARVDIVNPSRRSTVIERAGNRIWNVDTATSPAGWLRKSPDYRQLVLNKNAATVDDMGHIEEGNSYAPDPYTDSVIATPTGNTPMSRISTTLARKRGWGTVSWAFYGEFLDWLQARVNNGHMVNGQPDPILAELLKLTNTTPPGITRLTEPLTAEAIKKLAKIIFPVHAVGYNWLQSNLDSGRDLADKIRKEIIPTYQGVRGVKCTQVIVITHSMGGLVARAAAVDAGAADVILGVIHGVMPTDGAAAFYKRLAAGFGSEGGGLMGYIQSLVLGRTAQDTTPVIAYNPGPLELAPNKRYNAAKPWLFIKDDQGKVLKALPEHGDPYKEIYSRTDVAWRAVTPEWLNPAKLQGNDPYTSYTKTLDDACKYHDKVGGKAHPRTYAHYSADPTQKSWGSLTWSAQAGSVYTPSAYSISPAPTLSIPQWVPEPRRKLSSPESWRFEGIPDDTLRRLHDGGGSVRMTVQHSADAGDATVPAAASGAQVDWLQGCRLACAHNPGYEHGASYKSETVHRTVLDAIVRLVQSVQTG